jgi:hypothetical protein
LAVKSYPALKRRGVFLKENAEMMVIMTHPLHGRLLVYSQSEIESNKLAGWVVEENAPETRPLESAPEPAPPPIKPEIKSRKSFFGSDEGI